MMFLLYLLGVATGWTTYFLVRVIDWKHPQCWLWRHQWSEPVSWARTRWCQVCHRVK